MNALQRIAAERRRQIEQEGWTIEHDDRHKKGALADAAACYALSWEETVASHRGVRITMKRSLLWPWDDKYWKPTPDNRIRELVKAGALIVAEIERLERLEPSDSEPDLTLFTNGFEWWLAKDFAHLQEIYAEECGAGTQDEDDWKEWHAYTADEPFKMVVDYEPNIPTGLFLRQGVLYKTDFNGFMTPLLLEGFATEVLSDVEARITAPSRAWAKAFPAGFVATTEV